VRREFLAGARYLTFHIPCVSDYWWYLGFWYFTPSFSPRDF